MSTTVLIIDDDPVQRRLAEAMGARYLPLPHADAAAVSGAVRAAR